MDEGATVTQPVSPLCSLSPWSPWFSWGMTMAGHQSGLVLSLSLLLSLRIIANSHLAPPGGMYILDQSFSSLKPDPTLLFTIPVNELPSDALARILRINPSCTPFSHSISHHIYYLHLFQNHSLLSVSMTLDLALSLYLLPTALACLFSNIHPSPIHFPCHGQQDISANTIMLLLWFKIIQWIPNAMGTKKQTSTHNIKVLQNLFSVYRPHFCFCSMVFLPGDFFFTSFII